jgi:hypothetical protein
MIKFLLLCLSVSVQSAVAQQTHLFMLSGMINIDSGSVRFLPAGNAGDYPSSVNFSSIPVNKGKFQMSGRLEGPFKLRLFCQGAANLAHEVPNSQRKIKINFCNCSFFDCQ